MTVPVCVVQVRSHVDLGPMLVCGRMRWSTRLSLGGIPRLSTFVTGSPIWRVLKLPPCRAAARLLKGRRDFHFFRRGVVSVVSAAHRDDCYGLATRWAEPSTITQTRSLWRSGSVEAGLGNCDALRVKPSDSRGPRIEK